MVPTDYWLWETTPWAVGVVPALGPQAADGVACWCFWKLKPGAAVFF